MYRGKTQRELNSNFTLPVAERQTTFLEECLEYGYYGFFEPSLLTPEAQQGLKPLYIAKMNKEISQITDCYPIVKYMSANTDYLNIFVKSLTLSISSGTTISFGDDFKTCSKEIKDKTIAYILDPYDSFTEIYNYDFVKLLYQKPELTVTNEGVLLFYTPQILFATLNCNCGNIMSVEELAEAVGNRDIVFISSISVDEEGETVINFITKNKKIVKYYLKTIFDFFGTGGVTVKIE